MTDREVDYVLARLDRTPRGQRRHLLAEMLSRYFILREACDLFLETNRACLNSKVSMSTLAESMANLQDALRLAHVLPTTVNGEPLTIGLLYSRLANFADGK